jgi:uncharacterized membrane protein
MSKTGLEENIASLLCYALFWVTGLVFYLIETENETVRFHAMQSMIVFGFFSALSLIFRWVFWHQYVFDSVIGVIVVILWIILMVRAYQGGRFKLPVAGDLAEKWAAKKS